MKSKKIRLKDLQSKVSDILRATVNVCDKNGILYYCQAGTVLGAVRHKGPIPWDYDADIIIPENEIERFVDACTKDLPSQYWINYHSLSDDSFAQFPRIGLRGCSTDHLHLDVFRLIGLPDERENQIDMIKEGEEYRNEMKHYVRGMIGTLSYLKHGEIINSVKSLKRLLYRDTSFLEKMDDFCNRYKYEEAKFVMNPFGSYREKNIFNKEVYGKGKLVDYLDFKVRIPSEMDYYLKQYYGEYMKYPPQHDIDAMLNKVFEIEEVSF